ncbi:MAG: hypothetical protein RW306_02605 [Geobacteraceae bacterium]|nr:hypothetical protein [Geobacteraceae bacterium]
MNHFKKAKNILRYHGAFAARALPGAHRVGGAAAAQVCRADRLPPRVGTFLCLVGSAFKFQLSYSLNNTNKYYKVIS